MINTKMSLQYATYAFIATLGTFLVTGCNGSDQKASAAQAMPPLSVATYKVVAGDVPVSLEYPAKVKSMQQINVVARVSGILEKKYFTEGNFIKAGEMLYQIDSDRYEALMQEAACGRRR